MSRLVTAALAAAMAFSARSALAATYYVAPTGNNAAAGTAAQPWATLQYAVDKIAPGDTILVASGTYAGFRVGKSGTQLAPKTLKAAPGAAVTLNKPGPINKHASIVEIENWDGVVTDWVIDGLEISGAARYGVDLRTTSRVTVRYCNVHHSAWTGIFTAFSDYVKIHDNDSHDNGEHGVYHSNSGDYPLIRANLVHHNKAAGVHMNGDVDQGGDGTISQATVERNVVWENGAVGGAAINLDGVWNSQIRNNLLYDNHASGIALYAQNGAAGSSNNRVYANTVVMAAGARNPIYIGKSPDARPSPVGNQILGNILYAPDAVRASIETYAATSTVLTSDYNVVVNRFSPDGATSLTLAQWRLKGFDAHSILATPAALFVSPVAKNFHLRADSPAIDAGTSLAGVTSDYEGTARPLGLRFDIGCDEAK